jgi:hypothetical protein
MKLNAVVIAWDDFADPRFAGLGDSDVLNHVKALAYCARWRTNGFLPDGALSQIVRHGRPLAFKARMVSAGVWTATDQPAGAQLPWKGQISADEADRIETANQDRWRRQKAHQRGTHLDCKPEFCAHLKRENRDHSECDPMRCPWADNSRRPQVWTSARVLPQSDRTESDRNVPPRPLSTVAVVHATHSDGGQLAGLKGRSLPPDELIGSTRRRSGTFADLLRRAYLATGEDANPSSDDQIAALRKLFAGLDTATVEAGLRQMVDWRGPKLRLVTAGQATAVLTVADELGPEAFRQRWVEAGSLADPVHPIGPTSKLQAAL